MKKGINSYIILVAFIAGALISYFLTQFYLFNIDSTINVVEILISLLTIIIGLYIADTLQKRISRNHQKYLFFETKLDAIWLKFSILSQTVLFSDQIDLNFINSSTKEISHSLGFFKSITTSLEIDLSSIDELESKMDDYENKILSLSVENNLIMNLFPNAFQSLTNEINALFLKVLDDISKI